MRMGLRVAVGTAMTGAVVVQVAVARTVRMKVEIAAAVTVAVILRCDRLLHRLFCVWFVAARSISEMPIDPMTGTCKCRVLLLSGCWPPQVSSTLARHVEPPNYDTYQREAN